jgi:hypothetical protein
MTRPLTALLCGGPCKSSRCSERGFRVLTLSDASLRELYGEQPDLILKVYHLPC